jgi:hypothetical protein
MCVFWLRVRAGLLESNALLSNSAPAPVWRVRGGVGIAGPQNVCLFVLRGWMLSALCFGV